MSSDVPKKILWVFVFLILAAIAVLGVLFIKGYQSGKQVTSVEESPTPAASGANQESSIQVAITDPRQDTATTTAKMTISGTTAPSAIITITGSAEDAAISADTAGGFTTSVALNEGANMLHIQAVTEDGNTATTDRTIVYTKGTL